MTRRARRGSAPTRLAIAALVLAGCGAPQRIAEPVGEAVNHAGRVLVARGPTMAREGDRCDIEVQAEGYQDDPDMHRLVPEAAAVAQAVRSATPDARVASRVLVQGLVQSTRNTSGVALVGIEPKAEATISDWDEKIVEGGAWLEPDDQRGVIEALAKTPLIGSETDVHVQIGLDQLGQTRVDVVAVSRREKGDCGRSKRLIGRFLHGTRPLLPRV